MHTMNRRTFLGAGTAATAGLAFGLGSHDTLAGSALAQTVPDTSALNDLRSRLNGTLMTPKESGYESASAATNGRYLDIRPVAVARCADELDVVNCIVWCNEHGVSPVPRNGGHSYAGFSSTTGLLMDLRRLNTFDVDYASGTATVGGAALNNDALIATENGPLFLPGGTCLGVGFGGLTLGGGIGYNAHWAGLTSDHLQSTRIVTADGSLLDVDASNHSDLFWACRGGTGGTFGMNTSFTFDLVEVPQTDIGYYRFEWRGADDAAATLSAFDAIIQTAPPALNAVAMAEATEVGAGGPREAINVMSRGQYIGPVEELRELVQPLLDAATPTKQTLEEKTFWGMQRIIASGEPEPHSWGDISRYVADPIPDSATAAMVDLVAGVGGRRRHELDPAHRDSVCPSQCHHIDATDYRLAEQCAGVGGRRAQQVIDTLAPYALEESYQNFPNRSIDNWEQLYFAENYERLVDVKTKYDPDNLFNNPQSVQPR